MIIIQGPVDCVPHWYYGAGGYAFTQWSDMSEEEYQAEAAAAKEQAFDRDTQNVGTVACYVPAESEHATCDDWYSGNEDWGNGD